MTDMGTISIVGTPIGNLEDFTFRAKRMLETADVVVCEDTRVTKKLLDHYGLRRPVTALHHHSSPATIERLLDRVQRGENLAVVTDAGMPGVSDPAGRFVQAAQRRHLRVETVPGPSALTAALSISGLPTDRFLFLGFLPHKKGRTTMFARIANTDEAVAFFESPHRLLKTLEALPAVTGERTVMIARELTKIHESVIRGSAVDVRRHFLEHPDEIRGECVVVVGPR